jgi:hypothetical protein
MPNRARPTVRVIRRPSRSARMPAVNSRPAKTRVYELMALRVRDGAQGDVQDGVVQNDDQQTDDEYAEDRPAPGMPGLRCGCCVHEVFSPSVVRVTIRNSSVST